jgi:hypothetical protein
VAGWFQQFQRVDVFIIAPTCLTKPPHKQSDKTDSLVNIVSVRIPTPCFITLKPKVTEKNVPDISPFCIYRRLCMILLQDRRCNKIEN